MFEYRYIYKPLFLLLYMGFHRYAKAKKLLETLKRKHGEVISGDLLKQEIIKNIGGDEKQTLRPYLRMMFELKMIEEEGKNVRINEMG